MTTEVLAAASGDAEGGGSNFLLPNATFFVELILFLVIFFVFYRWIVPPLSRSMNEREEMIRQQAKNRDESVRKVEQARERYDAALAEARGEAAKIRDEARADAAKVREELREQADREVDRIRAQGEEQLAGQREEAVRRLRGEIGGLSTDLAARITGGVAPEPGRSGPTVERFLADLEASPAGSKGGGTD